MFAQPTRTAPNPAGCFAVRPEALLAPVPPAQPRRLPPGAVRSAWRLLPVGALGVAALVTGGLAGLLLGFAGGLLLMDRGLDRLLGMTGADRPAADHAFRRLSRERTRARLRRRLRRRAADDDLAYLADDCGWAAIAARRPLGVVPIEVASVVATADPHKAAAFDGRFRPPPYSRERWTAMYRAALHGVQLPPVAVYRVGARHVVRDGHHRVSVARAAGVELIDAHVTELIPAAPAMSGGGRSASTRTRAGR